MVRQNEFLDETDDLLEQSESFDHIADCQWVIVVYTRMIEADPVDAHLWAQRGRAREPLGDRLGALRDFEMAQNLNSESLEYGTRIRRLRENLGMTPEKRSA